jgi:hypothetical protein
VLLIFNFLNVRRFIPATSRQNYGPVRGRRSGAMEQVPIGRSTQNFCE